MAKLPLTERDIETMRIRFTGTEFFHDFDRLDDEITRVSDMLSDCWLLMDRIAREGGIFADTAKRLLRNHQAPGWK